MHYQGIDGYVYNVLENEKIAGGGEGTIYAIQGNDKQVAKIFRDDKKTKDKDLLIGMAPRGATEVIVRTANKYKKPFSILMCPNIKKSSKYDEDLDDLLELINSTKNDSYNVGVSYLDKNCYYPYPIVYKK